MNYTLVAIYIVGAFSVILGLLHFTFPRTFGFMRALPIEGEPLPPYKLLFYRYDMRRTDLRGIIYVMNHCVSYTILAIGIFDLYASSWIGTTAGAAASLVAAGFWAIRALTQLYLGRRPGDLFVIAFFAALAAVQVLVVFR